MPGKWAGVARLGSIGDNLIASSVLPHIKKEGYMIEVMAQAPSGVVFENNPNIDKLTILKYENLPNNNADWQQWFVKRSQEYDKFYHLSHSIESLVAFHPDTTWFWWPESFRRKIANRSYLEIAHDICEVPHIYDPRFYPTNEEVEWALERKVKAAPLGQKVIGWVIAGSRLDKIYPYSAMAISRLIKELNVAVIMFGGLNEKDHNSAKAIMDAVALTNSVTQNLHLAMGTGDKGEQIEYPLRKSITLAQQCDLVIGPDTGMMWSVAACNMPKMMMLGHATPKNITTGWTNTVTLHADPKRVDCWSCHRLHNDVTTCRPNKENNGAACISDISVECIIESAKAVLGLSSYDRMLSRWASNITLPASRV